MSETRIDEMRPSLACSPCMHGSAYSGDGAAMLRALGQVLGV